MSRAFLYHGLGIYGYHLRTWTKEGAIYLHVVRAKSRCGVCRSYKVIHKGYRWRTLKTLPTGRKPVIAVVRMRRFYCEECRKKHYTRGLERYVMDPCARMTILDVAESFLTTPEP